MVAVTSGSVLVTSRTYNLISENSWGLPKGASFGQYVPGWDESAAIGYGQEGRLVHLTQQPACTIPCGLNQDGLPIGLQIVGKMFDDAMVLRAAKAYESIRPITRPSLKWA